MKLILALAISFASCLTLQSQDFVTKEQMDSMRIVWQQKAKIDAQNRLLTYQNLINVDSVEEVNLSLTGLDDIPTYIFRFRNLKTLIISETSIKKLPKKINDLVHLKTINWKKSEVSLRSIKLKKNTTVERIYFQGNGMTKVPRRIGKFKALEVIDLSKNELKVIPKLKRLKNLHTVILSENPIQLTESRFNRIAQIDKLRLNNCKIDTLPPSLFALNKLVDLQLAENYISTVPNSISQLHNLEFLMLYKNDIKDLPTGIFELKKLQQLDIYYNNIEKIDPKVSKLKSLQILYLSNNRIYSLPEEVGNLPNLHSLYAHNNRLSYLPKSLKKLQKLKTLRINDNYFNSLPEEVYSLKNLDYLDFSNNQIESLSAKISSLSNLELLYFYGNPMKVQEGTELAKSIDILKKNGCVVSYSE